MNQGEHVMSVSEFNRITDNCLKQLGMACVTGEISECRAYSHLYFRLKDENSTVDCLMFSSAVHALPFKPEVGMQVVVSGQSSLYSKNGQFKLLVRSMQIAGRGLIMERLKALEEKLRREGVFDRLCRPLPEFPNQVGIITSLEGRVVHDIAMTLKRRNPGIKLRIYDAKVQGDGAVSSLIHALKLANSEMSCDVLIIGRGGGSFEDLLAFSDEALVRAVSLSKIPIVSAVGHEPDVALSDFAADVRAATPTAAAELVSKVRQEDCYYTLHEYIKRLEDAVGRFVDPYYMRYENLITRLEASDPLLNLKLVQQRLSALENSLKGGLRLRIAQEETYLRSLMARLGDADPQKQVERMKAQLSTLCVRCDGALTQVVHQQRTRLQGLYLKLEGCRFASDFDEVRRQLATDLAKLQALNPLEVLNRGYSVTLNAQGHQVKVAQLKCGDELTTLTEDGRIYSQITKLERA